MHPKLKLALEENKEALLVFEKLTPSYQKEIICYINALKSEESVDKNITKAIQHLLVKERFIPRRTRDHTHPVRGTAVLHWLSARHHGTQTIGGGVAAQRGISRRRATPQLDRQLSPGGWRRTKSPGQTQVYRIFEFDPECACNA